MMGQKMRQPAQAKPAPDFENFNLMAFLENRQDREGLNAARCAEVLQAETNYQSSPPQGAGRMVPDKLLKAAVVTQTSAAGLAVKEILDFVPALVAESEILDRVNVTSGHRGLVTIPSTTTAPSRGTPAEDGSLPAPAPVQIVVDGLPATLFRAQVTAEVTPEAWQTSDSEMSSFLATEGSRGLAAQVEDQLWHGNGANGQPTGVEASIVAGNTHTYVGGAITAMDSWLMINAMNIDQFPKAGRFFAASPDMSLNFTGLVYERFRGIHQQPLVDSIRPIEDGGQGRLYLISGPMVRLLMFGSESEVNLFQAPGSGIRTVGFLRLCALVFPKGPQAFRVLKVA